jgi:hypothetical protein
MGEIHEHAMALFNIVLGLPKTGDKDNLKASGVSYR